ncbi:MAG: formylglycine-generating enzyme family protein, partial [Chloroflexales bacterium]|nr:formylglycine-generating enzyme family protein [Chloroflexales bacterium]
REVILLAAGHLVAGGLTPQARAIGWALLEADPEGGDGFYRSAVLAGEVVEELGGVLGREGQALKEQVVKALVDLVQGGRLSAKERVEAAFLLGRLGDPRLPTPEQPAYWCEVAPGAFWYGDDRKGALSQQRLDYGFKIARYPVTNAEYTRFIEASGYEHEAWWTPNGWERRKRDIWSEPRYARSCTYSGPTQPIVGVSWYEAAAYCRWLTEQGHDTGWLPAEAELRLPTSLEWEHAARGGDDQRRYPWGAAAPTPEHANYEEAGIGRPAPVGCFPSGAAGCGAQDLLGNTFEWLATPSQRSTQTAAEKEFTFSEKTLVQWTYYGTDKAQLCCGSRFKNDPGFRVGDWGFRVLWSRELIE